MEYVFFYLKFQHIKSTLLSKSQKIKIKKPITTLITKHYFLPKYQQVRSVFLLLNRNYHV